MSKVTDIVEYKPHVVMQGICVACSYSCVSVSMVGNKRYDLECPRCGQMKMVLIGMQQEGGE